MLQNSITSKVELINKLNSLASTSLVQLIEEENIIENYQLTPLQNTLGVSLVQKTNYQSSLAKCFTSGELPIKNDPFSEWCCNDLFLYLKQSKQEVSKQQESFSLDANIQAELNDCSPYKWGDLVIQYPNEFLTIELTELQKLTATHFQSHRNCQLQVIQEIENDMKNIDPFWKNRLFIYKEAFLQIKVMAHLSPDTFKMSLEEQKMFDPELYESIEKNRKRFMKDPLTPNEQSRIWPVMMVASTSDPTGGGGGGEPQQQTNNMHAGGHGGGRSTRTLSTAVAPELAAFNAASGNGGEANEELINQALMKLKDDFLDKPAIQIYQAQIVSVIQTLFNCFTSSLESKLPGITVWCNVNSYSFLTIPLSYKSNGEKLQQIMNAISMQNFQEANKAMTEWLGTCEDDFYEAYRNDIAFIIAKTNIDSMVQQYCQTAAMQLMPMDQALFTNLSQHHPYGLVEIASLVACQKTDPNNLLMGQQYLMGMAQQQMAAQGQNLTPEQLQAMIQQSVQQQCAQIQQGLQQHSMMAEQLASVYHTNYPKEQIASTSPSSPPSSVVAATVTTGAEEESNQEEVSKEPQTEAIEDDGSNVFNKWTTNANFLIWLLSAQMSLEAVSSIIFKYYQRINQPQVAQLFVGPNRSILACLDSNDEVITQLKSIGSSIPTEQTPSVAFNIQQQLTSQSSIMMDHKIEQIFQKNKKNEIETDSETKEEEKQTILELKKQMKDPIFILLQESLHSIILECHSRACAECQETAPLDPSGALGQINALLNTPEGINDFISFHMTPQIKLRAQMVVKNQGGEQFMISLQQHVEEIATQSSDYIDMITKDIIPVYFQQLNLLSSSSSTTNVDRSSFAVLCDGCFAPTGVVDPDKLQMFIQFNVFRHTVRGDPSMLPKILNACQSNPPLVHMAQLMNANTEEFISGRWLPEECNIAYATIRENKIMGWHENEITNSTDPNLINDPLRPYAAELTFLLAKKQILESPTAETVASATQQLMQWGQVPMAQALSVHVNTMIQLCGGKLSHLESARLDSIKAREQATVDLRRKLNSQGNSNGHEALTMDRLRIDCIVPGSGFDGLEVLMLFHHFASSSSLSGGGDDNDDVDLELLNQGVLPLQTRLQARDDGNGAQLYSQIESYGSLMGTTATPLLQSEQNRLTYATCTGILRNCFSADQRHLYGNVVTDKTLVVPPRNGVIPPLDLSTIPYSVKLLCLKHLKSLHVVAQERVLIDSRYSPDVISTMRKSSVFQRYHMGGQSGTSNQFLLWKLEFIHASLGQDCHQQIYVEEKELGTLIFQNMDAFRAEPFANFELGTLIQILSQAIQSLSRAIGGPDASPFFAFAEDPVFLREKVWAQQEVDQRMKTLHVVSEGGEGEGGEVVQIKSLVMSRLLADASNCSHFKDLVERNIDVFINEPLTIKQQSEGWKQFLSLKTTTGGQGGGGQGGQGNTLVMNTMALQDRPELAQYILTNNIEQIRNYLLKHQQSNKDLLFAPYGVVGQSQYCYLLDAINLNENASSSDNASASNNDLNSSSLDIVNLLIENGYPVRTQMLTSEDGLQWPLLHYLMLKWSEHMKVNSGSSQVNSKKSDENNLYERYSQVISVFVANGCPLNSVANSMTPLYMAAVTSNELGLKAVLKVFNSFNVPSETCLNQFIPNEQGTLTLVHAVVTQGTDIKMIRLLKELGADLEIKQIVMAADYSIAQSNPPLHIALDAGHYDMAKEMIQLGCKMTSIKLLPWLKSELIKKIAQLDYVSDDMEEENSLSLMKVDVLTSAAFSTPELFELLISKGANVNYNDPTSGFSPMHQIMVCNNRQNNKSKNENELNAIEMIKVLLKHGADVNSRTMFGNTPLYLAVQNELYEVATFLLSNTDADCKIGNNSKETPFHLACFVGNIEFVTFLLENEKTKSNNIGNNVKELLSLKDVRGNDALMYTASFGKIELFELLVSYGADINTRNNDERSLFLQSVVGGQKDFAAYLVSKQQQQQQSSSTNVLEDVDSNGSNALHLLVKLLQPDSQDMTCLIAMWLISLGVNVLGRDRHLCYPLHYAAAQGHVAITCSLFWKMVEEQAFISSSTSSSTKVPTAGLMSFASVCAIGLDKNQVSKLKGGGKNLVGTPLFFAAYNRRHDVVKLFLSGIPRPHEMHPLVKVPVPQAGGVCDASGQDIPFPGNYMAAADGANFGMNESMYESAKLASDTIRSSGDVNDLKWKEVSSIHYQFLEPIELTELLCYSVDTVNIDLVSFYINLGASLDLPDLKSKRPLQYANIIEEAEATPEEKKLQQQAALEAMYNKIDNQQPGGGGVDNQFQVQNPLSGGSLLGSSSATTTLSPEALRNQSMEQIRTILVENGAQVFIANEDAHRGRHIRDHMSGLTPLHRMVWTKVKAQLLNETGQASIVSQDDELQRLPIHHAAARGSIPWLRVLREYQPSLIMACDKENWLCLHEASYGAQLDIIKLLLLWRRAQIDIVKDEMVRRGTTLPMAHHMAQSSVYSLDAETIYGETALELAKRGRNELLSETPTGLMEIRIINWTLPGMLLCSFFGIFFGKMIDDNGGGGFGFGLFFGFIATFGLIATLTMMDTFNEYRNNIKEQKEQENLSDKDKEEILNKKLTITKERSDKILQYNHVITLLEKSGCMGFINRWIHVKIWRNFAFLIFILYCSFTLPYCLLRDMLCGKPLSEAFIKIHTLGHGKNTSLFISTFSLALYLFFIIVPFQVSISSASYGISITAVYIIFLFLWVLFILYKALNEDRLWLPSKHKKDKEIRNNTANLSIFLVLFFEWQQLCSIGFIPNISWPESLNIQNWYSIFNLNLKLLGSNLGFNNFLYSSELTIPSNMTISSLDEAREFYESASNLNDLSNSETFTLYINLFYILIWFLITGYLAASCIVRSSPELQKIYPFIRSDFYGQLPGANLIMPLLANGFFLSILSSLLGVMTCAYAPSATDIQTDEDDDASKYLALLDEKECFHHSHKKSVMMSLLGLLFYMPSAFLVGVAFLNDEKNKDLDIRFIIAYEVIINFIKVSIGLLVLFSGQNAIPLFIFMIIFLLCLGYSTYTIKPCREIREVNITRTSFQMSAIFCTIVAAIAYGINDPSNDTPIVLFFIGNMIIFSIFIISYLKIPNYFEFNSNNATNSNNSNNANHNNNIGIIANETMGSLGSEMNHMMSNLTSTSTSTSNGNGILSKGFEENIKVAKQTAIHEATSFLDQEVFDALSELLGK